MNTKDISEPFNNAEDGYVKQNDRKSAFSLKNATIAVLIGGAAVLGSYMVQPAGKQAQEKLVEESTTLTAKDDEEIQVFDATEAEEDIEIVENVIFEDEKLPDMDLNKPWMDIKEMLRDQEETDAIINDDLTEFRRVRHGQLTDMDYDNTLPSDVIPNGNQCSSQERDRMGRATEKTLEIVKKSMANYDEKKFRKWFGADNGKQNDIMVKNRIRNTYNFMKDGYGSKWNVICCHN